jgi:hypothetical protein
VSSIDRLRYYDGEFLRAFDFTDEQTYHREMRRRLNRYLHLHGIVRGLQLYEDVQGSIHEVSILPGLAIDDFGREIYVFAPYTFGESDLTANRISVAGQYDVWLRYSKSAGSPPSAGYAACNQNGQYNRWIEGFTVVLLASPSNPFTPPVFTDDDLDDPTQDQVGVLLGTVSIDPSSVNLQFSSPVFHRRHFWGVIAQRIDAPPPYEASATSTPPFNVQNRNSALNPPVSLEVSPNIFARQNLIVGPDFDVNKTPGGTKITIKPSPTTSLSGTVKLAGDLFALGNIYSSVPDSKGNPQFLGISENVKQLVQQTTPDFVSTTTPPQFSIVPTAAGTNAGVFSDTVSFDINSNLASMSNVVATASLAGMEFNNPVNPAGVELFFTVVRGVKGANKCTVQVSYSVSPVPATLISPISTFWISASAVCFP